MLVRLVSKEIFLITFRITVPTPAETDYAETLRFCKLKTIGWTFIKKQLAMSNQLWLVAELTITDSR